MAATGTPTPNIGLRIPLGTDPASVDDINYNSNLLDTKLGAVGNDSVQDQIDELNGKSISSLANGTSQGYVSFANGFMMQWGKAVIPIGSDRVQVNFNPYYDHHIPMVTFTPEENGNAAGAVSDLRVFDTSYTKFVVYNKNGSVTSKDIIVNWIAIGTWSNI